MIFVDAIGEGLQPFLVEATISKGEGGGDVETGWAAGSVDSGRG
jgi:hypothetical protein